MTRSVWISGFEGMYMVTDQGHVLSAYLGMEILKGGLTTTGYPAVSLHIKGAKPKRKWWIKTHILVAKHFVPGFKPGLQVNHKNGIKTDNRAENLEWVTAKQNMIHAELVGLTNRITTPITAKHIVTGKENKFVSITAAARAIGVSRGSITACQTGKRKSVRGYEIRKTVSL